MSVLRASMAFYCAAHTLKHQSQPPFQAMDPLLTSPTACHIHCKLSMFKTKMVTFLSHLKQNKTYSSSHRFPSLEAKLFTFLFTFKANQFLIPVNLHFIISPLLFTLLFSYSRPLSSLIYLNGNSLLTYLPLSCPASTPYHHLATFPNYLQSLWLAIVFRIKSKVLSTMQRLFTTGHQ